MRTDGVQVAPEALAEAREVIGGRFGADYVPEQPRYLQDQGQERPGGARGDPPDQPGAPPRLPAARGRPRPALRADLEADDRQPDGGRAHRAHHRRPRDAPTARPACAPPARWCTFDGYLAVYEEGRDDADDDEDGGRLPAVNEGAGAKVAARPRRPALHRAAAALLRSQPGQEAGRARHRPALDLRLDPDRAARPRIRAHGQEPLHPRGQGPAGHRLPGAVLRAATSSTTSPPPWRRSSTWSRPASWTGRCCCATSGRTSSAAVGEHRRAAHHPGARRAERGAGPAHLPRQGGRRRPARLPDLRHGPLSLKTGKFGAFIGCSNYPECRYTRPLAAPDGGEDAGRERRPRAGRRSGRPAGRSALKIGRFGPYVETAAEGEDKPKRCQPAQGLVAGGHGPGEGAAPAAPAARGRACTPRTASRSWPASAATVPTSCTTAPTPTSPTPTRCSRSA